MKKLCFALFTLAAIASASPAVAATGNHVYLQAAPVYAIPSNDLEIRSGVALALGTSFDEIQELELEGTAYSTEFKPTNSAAHSVQSDLKFKHLLATYRYLIPVDKSFRLFAGLSAGVAHVAYEVMTVDQNMVAATTAGSYTNWLTVIGYMTTSSRSYSPYQVLPPYTQSTYNQSDGTLTQRFSGSNTVAAGGPQLGFEYDWDSHSTIVISAKWIYIAKTDVTKAGATTFVQAAYRYVF